MKAFDNHRVISTKVVFSGPTNDEKKTHRTRLWHLLSNGSSITVTLDELPDGPVSASVLPASKAPKTEEIAVS